MSQTTEAGPRLPSRHADINDRLQGLETAVKLSRGRVDDGLIREAETLVDRAKSRLVLSGDHTVVALAGATGSGKSSLFNVLSGLEIAAVGVKRPTSSWPLACTWGRDGATALLDWLEIPRRHQVDRISLLDESPADRDLQGLVLLDLPDHDSTEVAHHLEVHRLVELADLLVWVLDPQKYADAVIHDRFLRPLHDHADSMLVLLNHSDEISPDAVGRCVADISRLLELDGLGTVPVLATSATTGDGVPELRRVLADRVAAKAVAQERLSADIRTVSAELAAAVGDAHPPDPRTTGRTELLQACAEAAGIPALVRAVERTSVARTRAATDWPLTREITRRRPDAAGRLRPTDPSGGAAPGVETRRRIPAATPVQRARVDAAVRRLVDRTVEGMRRPWADAVRHASVSRLEGFADALEAAIARTDLGSPPRAWPRRGVRLVQWLLLLAAVVGAVWLLGLLVTNMFRSPDSRPPAVAGVWVPVLLLVGGLFAGFAISVAGRIRARRSARARAERAENQLRSSLETAVDDFVLTPMATEVDAYRRTTEALAQALAD
jgi:GTP-binding protein EngB required for normal cell division